MFWAVPRGAPQRKKKVGVIKERSVGGCRLVGAINETVVPESVLNGPLALPARAFLHRVFLQGCAKGARAFVSGSPLARPPPPPKRAQLTGLPKSYRDGPPGPRGDPGPKFGKKNENGIFGISALRGLRKVIICHGFGENVFDNFQC